MEILDKELPGSARSEKVLAKIHKNSYLILINVSFIYKNCFISIFK